MIHRVLQEIESHQFAVRVNVASDLRTFLRALQEEQAVATLLRELDAHLVRASVLLRVLDLSSRRVDPRFENPADTALATYLFLLNVKAPRFARMAAEAAFQTTQCWWARRLAQRILFGKYLTSDAGLVCEEMASTAPRVSLTSSESDNVLLLGNLFLVDVPLTPMSMAATSTPLVSAVTTCWSSLGPSFLALKQAELETVTAEF